MRPRLTLKLMLPFVIVCAVSWAATAGAQAAEPWGELGHFADKSGELAATQPAFGINPEDGSAWVGDIVQNKENNPVLRIQKFAQEAGVWKIVASDEFTLGVRTVGNEEPAVEMKGIAFDPELHRAYVLVEEERVVSKPEVNAAAQLWEFTTNSKTIEGKALVDRTEGAYKGPVGESAFDPQVTSTKASHLALDEPSGIAVDPKNHNILITGWVGAEGNPVASIWAISKEGKIEEDWEDKEGKEAFFEEAELNSPVVTASGNILVLAEEPASVIYEIPAALNTKAAPKVAMTLPELASCNEKVNNHEPACPYIEKLTTFSDSGKTLSDGGRMSIGPEGDIYIHSRTANVFEKGSEEGSVMVLKPTFEEIGWTGGGPWTSGTRSCAIADASGGGVPAMIAAGSESVFMYEPGALPRKEGVVRIMQLGPKGSTAGCPLPEAKVTATAGGTPIEGIAVPIVDKVVFETSLEQANAVSTEWEVEPGVVKTVAKREQQSTRFEYKFLKPGKFTVKEMIHTDDLAKPVLTKETSVEIAGPIVQHEEALVEGNTTATLKGEVNPGGQPTTCEFQYEEVGVAGVKKAACPTPPGEEPKFVKESVKLENLKAGKEYLFKLVATTGEYHTEQAGTKFTMPALGAPEVHTEPATAVTSAEATLNGKVNPEGTATTCFFKYGTNTKYESGTAPCASAPGSGSVPVAVSAKLGSLAGATTYHFLLVAEGKGTTEGTDQSFTTPSAAGKPVATTGAAVGITQTTATIKGSVNPEGAATTCVFEYGTTTAYGSKANCATAPGSGHGAVEESLALSGLSNGTVYHYRIVAHSSAGETFGGDGAFETQKPIFSPPPGPGPAPEGEVKHETTVKPVPAVTISGLALTVAANGSFSLKLSCPAGETQCSGTVTIKTLSAVAASARAAKKKAILTLASGSFTIVGGKLKAISLHLSSKAKALLAKLHTVRARVTIVAHDSAGGAHTTTAVVTLKAAKKKH